MIALLLFALATVPHCQPACDDSHYCDWRRVCDGFTGECKSTGETECRWKPEREPRVVKVAYVAALTLQTPDLTCRVRSKKGYLVRSRARVCLFLRMAGYLKPGEMCRVPVGNRVDHIIPLACGGCDLPANYSLLSVEEHAAKSKWERKPCAAWWDGTNTQYIQAGRGIPDAESRASR